MSDPAVQPVGFVLTPALVNHVRTASLTGSVLAFALCLLVCLASIWVYSIPSARHHLDRVSFRLLLWSMVMEIPYNICFIVVTRDPSLSTQLTRCGATVYLLLATMGMCNWLCTCIGVNLMLAITFGINPLHARLERWYIAGSFILGFGVPIVPAALGHFGWDPLYQACYFTQGDKLLRLKDLVVDLYFWQLLSSLIAAASVLAVLITLLKRSRETQRAMFRGDNLTVTASELREITMSAVSKSSSLDSPTGKVSWYRRLLGSRSGHRSHMHRLEDKLAGIALKISLYPLALLVINTVITSEDLSYNARGGLFSMGDYVFFWLHNFLYGGRGIFFALLGIFVDPCLRLGVPAAHRATFPRHTTEEQTEEKVITWDESHSFTEFLASPGPEDNDDKRGSYFSKAVRPSMGRRGSSIVAILRGSDATVLDEKGMMELKDIKEGEMENGSIPEISMETSGLEEIPQGRHSLSITVEPLSNSRPVRFSSPLDSPIGLLPPSSDPNTNTNSERPASDTAAKRRRHERHVVAEEMYAETQKGL